MSLFTIAIIPEKPKKNTFFENQILEAIEKIPFKESKIIMLESHTTSLDYFEQKDFLEELLENKIQKMKKKGLSEAKIEDFIFTQKRKNEEILRKIKEDIKKIERKILDFFGTI